MGSFTCPFGGFKAHVGTFNLNLWDNWFRGVEFSTLAKCLFAPVTVDKAPKKDKMCDIWMIRNDVVSIREQNQQLGI